MRRAPAMPVCTIANENADMKAGMRSRFISPTSAISSLSSMPPARSSTMPCRSESATATPNISIGTYSASMRPWRTNRSRNSAAPAWNRLRSQVSRTAALTSSMPDTASSAVAVTWPYWTRCSISTGPRRRV